MPRRRHRTAARNRAQTAQDFALGIGFFVVAVAFVFAFIPSMLAFTTADPGAKAAAQADRSADAMLRDLGTGDRPNELNGTRTATYFNTTSDEADLQAALGLPDISFVNVTVRSLADNDVEWITDENGTSVPLRGGRDYAPRQPAAESARLVTMTHDGGKCEPACQLVVRVW